MRQVSVERWALKRKKFIAGESHGKQEKYRLDTNGWVFLLAGFHAGF
jgi:hypothetical protein